ncbi:hypothetical protein [Paludisphaera soli]|uniref:hypothetical protein n=1 Tax=Paludisphaera soli TaxID=2712865 RepID=UPI0013ECD9B9|nr:hypothetical protein [Paludisphaera soli]
MKLEFLPDGSDDCPLVRVFDFRPEEAAGMLTALGALASGERETIAVHEWPGVEAVDGCRLVLRVGPGDRGVIRLRDAGFECVLSQSGWDQVAGLVEPFSQGGAGYQWLVRSGDASWLISRSGLW